MGTSKTHELSAPHDGIVYHTWPVVAPTWIAVLVHGYGEHLGRYDHMAAVLNAEGAYVIGPDHKGHGLSQGERVLISDFEEVVADLDAVVQIARGSFPGVPVVMIGHSMGGMIAARYGQVHGDQLRGLVLSGPVLGSWAATDMADLDIIPDVPIDTEMLSRDPAVGKDYVADPLVWHGSFKRDTLRSLRRTLETINEGGTLTPPTLWLHGDDDRLVPIEPTRVGIERIKGDVLAQIAYPGAQHEVFNETNKEEVIAAVTDFAAKVIAG